MHDQVPVVEGSVLLHRAFILLSVPQPISPDRDETSKFTRFQTIADIDTIASLGIEGR